MHEQYIKELAKNVFRGQEGAVIDDYCVGDCCLGYTSEPIPGSEKGRRKEVVYLPSKSVTGRGLKMTIVYGDVEHANPPLI